MYEMFHNKKLENKTKYMVKESISRRLAKVETAFFLKTLSGI